MNSQPINPKILKPKLHEVSSSPYLKPMARPKNMKPISELKSLGHFPIKSQFSDGIVEQIRLRDYRRHHTSFFEYPSKEDTKAKYFEDILHERLERAQKGDHEFSSELEAVDSVFSELAEYLSIFKEIFNTLRIKLAESLEKSLTEKVSSKLEKLKKKNHTLLAKLQAITKYNSELIESNEEIKKKQNDYQRLFEENPDILVRYSNIVEEMLKQCDLISSLKKENKELRKDLAAHIKVIMGLKLKKKKYKEMMILLDNKTKG